MLVAAVVVVVAVLELEMLQMVELMEQLPLAMVELPRPLVLQEALHQHLNLVLVEQ